MFMNKYGFVLTLAFKITILTSKFKNNEIPIFKGIKKHILLWEKAIKKQNGVK